MENNELMVLGVDIAKKKFDICLLKDNKERKKVFDNDLNGFEQLSQWLKSQNIEKAHACIEATGRYYEALANYLCDQGFFVSVVNPTKIKGFAQSELKRLKTDKIDAGIIARFCRAHRPPNWKPLPAELRELQEAERYLSSLKSMRVQESNRLGSGLTCPKLIALIEANIAHFDHQIKDLEKWIKEHIKSHEKMRNHHELITSIIGIGDVTAAIYLGEIGYVERFNSTRQVESFAGLMVRQHTSGSSIHGKSRMSKVGNSHLRMAFYMPALSAMQNNPVIRVFVERLKQKGKAGKVIVGAVMRKLLRLIHGVLRSGRPFDISYQPALNDQPKAQPALVES